MESKYNTRSPAVKRLMREAHELSEATPEYFAQPLSDNLFEWHFTVRGPTDTEFDGGVYHGRIILPPEYPMKPPNIIMLTPNGRFETGKKICLSISEHHPESWQPSWSIRTAMLAIIGFMPTPGHGTLGSLDYSVEERRQLAQKSALFRCEECGGQQVVSFLKCQNADSATTSKAEAKEIIKSLSMKAEDESQMENVGEKVDPASSDSGQKKTEMPVEESAEQKERRLIREASVKVQQRFRQRIEARAPGLVSRLQDLSTSANRTTSASAATNTSDPAANPAAAGSRGLATPAQPNWPSRMAFYDVLMAILVLVIALLLYRRFSTSSSGEDASSSSSL